MNRVRDCGLRRFPASSGEIRVCPRSFTRAETLHHVKNVACQPERSGPFGHRASGHRLYGATASSHTHTAATGSARRDDPAARYTANQIGNISDRYRDAAPTRHSEGNAADRRHGNEEQAGSHQQDEHIVIRRRRRLTQTHAMRAAAAATTMASEMPIR